MPDTPGSPRVVTLAKELLGVTREALLVAVFLLLLLWPAGFNGILERAGFTKGSLMGFEWEKQLKASTEQAKGAGDAITQIEERLTVLQANVERLSGPDATALKAQVRELVENTQKADQATKNSLLTQQRLIAEATPSAVEIAGWIYAGKTDSARTGWTGDQSVIVPLSQLREGTRVSVDRDVYLRDNDGRDPKNLGRVIGVLPQRAQVIVQGVAFHQRATFVAVWLKVRRT